MAGKIDLRPTVVDLKLYAGDGFTIKLACVDIAGAPIDISGSVAAQIRADRLNPNTSPLASFAVSLVDGYLGIVALSLDADQTIALLAGDPSGFEGVWDVEWTPAEKEPRTIVQGSVECVPDVTR